MLICPKCGTTINTALQRKVGPHLGLYCPFCGRWLKWQKQHKLPDDIVNNLPDDIVNNLPDDITGDMPPWEV